MIVAMWHGQFLLLPLIKPKTVPVHNMVAKHTDGEMIARTLLHFDMGLIRGAGAGEKGKDRGGAGALRAALKALRANITVALTTDIPPGPARVAGMGIVTLARMSGRPIVPLAVGDRAVRHAAHLEPLYDQPAIHEARDGGGRSDLCAARCQRRGDGGFPPARWKRP